MTTFYKLIDGELYEAPTNYENIINFNLSEELMREYGYKPLVEATREENHYYNSSFEEREDYIAEVLEDKTEWYLEQKAKEEAIKEQEALEQEQYRVTHLHLTRGDVFRGLLQAKGITRAQIRAVIEQMPEETQEQQLAKEMALIDFDEALEFYRGVPLIGTIGAALGITPEQMTDFFETNDYTALLNTEEETQEE